MTPTAVWLIIGVVAELIFIVLLYMEIKAIWFELQRLDNLSEHVNNAINGIYKDVSMSESRIAALEENGVKPTEFELSEDEKREQEKYMEGLDSILNFHSQKKAKKGESDE